jgi:hypothetical protein
MKTPPTDDVTMPIGRAVAIVSATVAIALLTLVVALRVLG